MEINVPIDRAIGIITFPICSIICFVFLRKPLVKVISEILRNLWGTKEFLVELYGIALLPHSIILSLKGFSAYYMNDRPVFCCSFLAAVSISVLFFGTVAACFGAPFVPKSPFVPKFLHTKN